VTSKLVDIAVNAQQRMRAVHYTGPLHIRQRSTNNALGTLHMFVTHPSTQGTCPYRLYGRRTVNG